VLPEVGVAPVLAEIGVAVLSSVVTDPLVTRRFSSSVPVLVAAAVRIRPAAAIGGSSCKEYF
jgi:hypothetical protein